MAELGVTRINIVSFDHDIARPSISSFVPSG
jgi:hypothetical protein